MIAPRISLSPHHLLSWYLYIIGGAIDGALHVTGGVDTGWTSTPRSAKL